MSVGSSRYIEARDDHSRRINLVPEPTAERLNPRQYESYLSHRDDFIRWLLHFGRNPDKAEGYAYATVYSRATYHDQFARWTWDNRTEGFTLALTHEHADDYMDALEMQGASDSKKANTYKALRNYFAWREDCDEWDARRTWTGDSGRDSPHDYLKREERDALREAALEYGTVPAYNALTPDQRDKWKHLLAERFRKPKSEVGREDFQRANGFKTPSIIYTALDAALRPTEVGRLKAAWFQPDNMVLQIPADHSTKNRDNWTVSLRAETTQMVNRWLDERECYDKYDDSPYMWLTRTGNQYSPRTCNYLFRKLCDLAGIDYEARNLSWYAIRHSTGTYLSSEGGLKSAADQLRHKSLDTTKRYNQSPPDDRREDLERI